MDKSILVIQQAMAFGCDKVWKFTRHKVLPKGQIIVPQFKWLIYEAFKKMGLICLMGCVICQKYIFYCYIYSWHLLFGVKIMAETVNQVCNVIAENW